MVNNMQRFAMVCEAEFVETFDSNIGYKKGDTHTTILLVPHVRFHSLAFAADGRSVATTSGRVPHATSNPTCRRTVRARIASIAWSGSVATTRSRRTRSVGLSKTIRICGRFHPHAAIVRSLGRGVVFADLGHPLLVDGYRASRDATSTNAPHARVWRGLDHAHQFADRAGLHWLTVVSKLRVVRGHTAPICAAVVERYIRVSRASARRVSMAIAQSKTIPAARMSPDPFRRIQRG